MSEGAELIKKGTVSAMCLRDMADERESVADMARSKGAFDEIVTEIAILRDAAKLIEDMSAALSRG